MDNITNLLKEVGSIIKTHEEHANKQGENFNIFKILRMERREVKTHSNFIYELLNPNGLHGQGDIFLKSFAKIVIKSEVPDTVEKPQQEDLTDKNRRIDFTLETEKNVIGIEMKIDAGDQKSQLFDYQQEIKKRAEKCGKTTKLFYLTLNNKEASDESLEGKGSLENLTHSDYTKISFENEILKWITDCIQKSAEKSVLREAIIQYKILIEKLTGENMDVNNEIADIIGKEDNIKSALAIEIAVKQAKINFQIEFWKELFSKLDDKIGELSFCNRDGEVREIKELVNNFYSKGKCNRGYGICCETDNKNCAWIEADGYVCIDGYNKEGEQIDEALSEFKELNFYYFNENTVNELTGENRDKNIKKLIKEFKELVNKMKESEK
jgi:hypothetical protein